MPDQMSLDGILNDEKPEPREPAAEAPPAEEPPAGAPPVEAKDKPPVERAQSKRQGWRDREQDAQGRVRDPVTGQYLAKTEKPAEEPAKAADPNAAAAPPPAEAAKPAPAAAPQQEPLTDKEKAFLRAAQEERGKRQALEARLAALEGVKPAPGAATEPAKTFWDDPDGALKRHEDSIRTETTNARLNTSEFIARQRHTDFDEKVAVFRDFLTKGGPNSLPVAQQWLAAPDPAMYAYNFGKNHLELQQVGGLDAMRAKIEKETEAKVRAAVEAEATAKADALAKQRSALPGSLSDARSTGANRPAWGGPTTLEDVLKG